MEKKHYKDNIEHVYKNAGYKIDLYNTVNGGIVPLDCKKQEYESGEAITFHCPTFNMENVVIHSVPFSDTLCLKFLIANDKETLDMHHHHVRVGKDIDRANVTIEVNKDKLRIVFPYL